MDWYHGYLITDEGYFQSVTPLGNGFYQVNNSHNELIQTYTNYESDLYEPSGDIRHFDHLGNLVSITNLASPGKNVTLNSYESSQGHVVTTATDAFGRSITFEYVNQTRLTRIDLPDGNAVSYQYDANSNLTGVDYGGGQVKHYLYSETGLAPSGGAYLLTGIVSEDGQRYATFKYDAYDRAISSVLNVSGGSVATTTLSYVDAATVSVTTDTGATRTYKFDSTIFRHPLSVSDSAGTTTSTYDTLGRLSTTTDPRGIVTQYLYQGSDLWGVVSGQGTTSQRRVETDHDPVFNLPTERRTLDSSGKLVAKTDWTYNARGQESTRKQTDPVTLSTRITTRTYCEQSDVTAGTCPIIGLLASIDGSRTDISDVTTYTYYPSDDPACATAPTACPHRLGDLWKITDALGHVKAFLSYDGAGRPLSMADANGVETDMTYSPRGWLTQRAVRGTDNTTTADDAITTFDYDPLGQLNRVTQPDGSYFRYTHDTARRLTDITDNLGNTIHYTLDNAGHLTREDTKDPSGVVKHSMLSVFNSLGQLQTSENANAAANASYTYDADGNTSQITDGLSHITTNTYDPLNRLTGVLQDPKVLKVNTNYSYDALDRISQVTDPQGLKTIYSYDGVDNLTSLNSPDSGVTNFTYDPAGNRKTKTDARGTTASYSYDAMNRLTGISYPTSTLNVSFVYDVGQTVCSSGNAFGVNRLTHYADGSGSTSLCYDRFGNLAQKVQTISGSQFITSYAYDMARRLTQVTTPNSTIISYHRDAVGRITSVSYRLAGQNVDTPVVISVTYYPYGPVASITYGNGRVLSRTFDQDYVVSAVNDPASGGLALTFSRDVLGNLTQIQSGTVGNKYSYDALNRLTTVNDLNKALIAAYAYDGTGNRLSKQVGTTKQLYTYPLSNHHLIDVAGTGRTYDASGNTATIGAQGFRYDDTDRMYEFDAGGVLAKSYQYNARGARVRKYHGANTAENQYTIYDEVGHTLGEYDNNAAPIRETIWLDRFPVGVLSGSAGTLAYIEPDQLGSPRTAIDSTRNKAVWSWPILNDPFGESTPNQDPDGDGTQFTLNLRLPGQYYDAESGLAYNYFRDYNASTGRYMESDPIGLEAGLSTYAYTSNSPLSQRDPSGLQSESFEYPVPVSQRQPYPIMTPPAAYRPPPEPPRPPLNPDGTPRNPNESNEYPHAEAPDHPTYYDDNTFYCTEVWCDSKYDANKKVCHRDSDWLRISYVGGPPPTVDEISERPDCECRNNRSGAQLNAKIWTWSP